MASSPNNGADENLNGSVKKNGTSGVPAKGILKSSQQSESLLPSQVGGSQPLISSNTQLPHGSFSKVETFDGNNTTSRINTLALQERGNRRVSFAPDVTLHSFDFVPETNNNHREPRRKAVDLVVTSTQQDDLDDEDGATSQSMDLTSPVAVSTQPYRPVFDQEVSMEITQLFAKHDGPQTEGKEETMEFTKIQEPAIDVGSKDTSIDNGGNTMELTAIQRSDLKTALPTTPPSSKRRKLNPEQHGAEPESPEEQDMELSVMEKMSPIKLPQPDLQIGTRQCHSLREFINETGVSFLIDTDLVENRKNAVVFRTALPAQRETFRINQLLNALYLDTPVLEMNAFICKELLRRIRQSKKQFDDLDEQVSSAQSPPLLFTEYFSSSLDLRQLMNQQLQLVKSYSKLEAKKSWYEWRTRHLNGIKTVLTENLNLLEEDRTKVKRSMSKVQDIKAKAESLRNSIRREINALKESTTEDYQEEPGLNERVKLEALKQSLALYSVEVNDLQDVKQKNKQLKEEIDRKKNQLFDLKKQLTTSSQNYNKRLKRRKFTEYDLARCRSKLRMLGLISGVEFVRYQHSELTICFPYINSSLQISINISDLNSGDLYSYKVIKPSETAIFFDHCYRNALRNHPEMPTRQRLSLVALGAKSSIPVIKELSILRLLFPVQILHRNGEATLEIKDYDLKSRTKAIYDVDLKEFLEGVIENERKITLKASVIERGRLPASSIPTAFLKKVTKILPWFNESKVTISIVESSWLSGN